MKLTKSDRIQGGFWGLLVGDALGVPYEFHPANEIPPQSDIDFTPPAGFHRAHASVPPGTWSDDGAQALCLLDSLLTCGDMNPDDFANRLLEWYEKGKWAVDGYVFDVGNQTSEAIRAFRAGTPSTKAGFVRPNGKGNGSLMRVLPLALWHQGTDADLIEDAHLQSTVTHGHPCNQVCCALYCIWVRRVLSGMQAEDAYLDAVSTLRDIYSGHSTYLQELEWEIRPDEEPHSEGSGYVVDSLRSVRLTISQGSYEEVIKAAVALGNDTDTNAAIAGGLAGVRDGLTAIPEKWMENLRGREFAEPLLKKLLDLSGEG
ncbi:ADP-ribosylglycohydrolase family protein [Paenactinomyces guangxiensis]|uniref:ADP-ribosylglycohydrolase family protein n=1 Tax=Paenactinomyces guangxiensis TaxID=1490290 RepID=A0A7W2A9G3_9BACL|nr:ADP-ribosylglycohydrolase family protein [Paenactinomyces guangxiensis]MBA4495152.1 ADP-ribosylglycohydrolase family protein [Paenactinomyces guangxiensis]MBH8592164.1 ADP-ribosylglycohydrolase family protein [Paenactinomyces guangxiensis]